MRRLHAAALVFTVSVVASATTAASRLVQAQPVACEMLVLGGGYVASVNTALRSKTDVWGNRLLARPEGRPMGTSRAS
jgi:hypothetical protein